MQMTDPSVFPYHELPTADAYVGDHTAGEIELAGGAGGEAAVVFANQYFTVLNDAVVFPNGSAGHYVRIINNSELRGLHGTVMVPTFGDEVFLIRLFRHPVRAWSVEFPRGFAEIGLTEVEIARREVQEELGVEAADAIQIGTISPNTGQLATRAKVFHVPLKSRPQLAPVSSEQAAEAISQVMALDRRSFAASLGGDSSPLRGVSCAFTLGAMLQALAKGILT